MITEPSCVCCLRVGQDAKDPETWLACAAINGGVGAFVCRTCTRTAVAEHARAARVVREAAAPPTPPKAHA